MVRRRSRLVVLVAVVVVFLLYNGFRSSRLDYGSAGGQAGRATSDLRGGDRVGDGVGDGTGDGTGDGRYKSDGHPDSAPPPPLQQRPGALMPPRPQAGDLPDHNDVPEKNQVDSRVGQPWLGAPPGSGNRPNEAHEESTVVHWQRTPEFYPVSPADLIPLPRGDPLAVPRIQFDFSSAPPESALERTTRQARLEAVREAMRHSWNGYRTHAWMHDEVRPHTGETRDPFCGWAATLVDALDTLWIMGMRSEFDEAARAVAGIDFTTTSRDSIPVFETVIRYLGGLLAAYDVSGGHAGKYPVLLEKAVELAEMLFPVFDTPNRMPVLYYRWKPSLAGAPRRAGTVAVAELGSMTMEFTRLAQLTGTKKYYDAAARLTDALEELQRSGQSKIPGIFPESLDASGCNATALKLLREAEEAPEVPEAAEKRADDVTSVQEGDGALHKRAPLPPPPRPQHKSGAGGTLPECIPQPLVPRSGMQTFSMGASQDSTYEYFPKQFLLLGGLVPKYKQMHLTTVQAIKDHLLFRPMIPDETRDLRFSAKIEMPGQPDQPPRVKYEAPHLTCFLGGMFGLGGRIFGRPDDVEIAKKLTDGCVWAYESMPAGIMAEGGTVAPCPRENMLPGGRCAWNETEWHHLLDPDWERRQLNIEQWEARRQQRLLEEQEEREEEERLRSSSNDDDTHPPTPNNKPPPTFVGEKPLSHAEFLINKLNTNAPPPGFVSLEPRYYILRPEAIESVWYMYRITGERAWMDKGWRMFEAIVRATRARYGHSALDDVSVAEPSQTNAMESFWMAETLKYFYLLFAEPDEVSLDEWVFNTEAHPFRRPVAGQAGWWNSS